MIFRNLFRGSAAEYDPDYLLDQDIVLVTLQYRFCRCFINHANTLDALDKCDFRLGMFGFLSTETKDAPGNYGMLDQVSFS